MTETIHVDSSPGEVRIAVERDGALIDYALWRPGAPDGVGDLHRGRVVGVVPAMAGVFVALDGAEGFLPDSEGGKGLTVGTVLGVRVIRAAQGHKGPRLTARLSEAEHRVIGTGSAALVRRGPDPLHRLAERYKRAEVLTADTALAAALRPALGARLRLSLDATLPDPVGAAVDALAEPVVALANGARLSIWPTPALVAIDIDAGAAAGDRKSGHEAINRAILPALAAQIRLRNLSGAIVVDLAGLSARRRAALGPDLEHALASDPLRPRFLGFTALGLAEIVRPRIHPPLHELAEGPLAAGLAALRAVLREQAGPHGHGPAARSPMRGLPMPRLPVARWPVACWPVLRAAPSVVAALQADPAALPDLVRRTGHNLIVRSDPSLPGCTWVLEYDHA